GRGAARPAGDGRCRQCVLQRVVLRFRTPAGNPGEFAEGPVTGGATSPRHVVAQQVARESHDNRRYPARAAGMGLRQGRGSTPSLRPHHPERLERRGGSLLVPRLSTLIGIPANSAQGHPPSAFVDFVSTATTPHTRARQGMNLALATWVSAINF